MTDEHPGHRTPRLILPLPSLAILLTAGLLATGASAQTMIDRGSTGSEKPLEAFDAASIALVDLSGDGVKEIITNNDNNNLYVFDGATGDLIAELETNHPDNWGARNIAGPAIGDVNGNGLHDIVTTNSAGWITAFEAQPTGDTTKLNIIKLWETYLDPHEQDPDYSETMEYGEWNGHPGLDGPPFLADTHEDGYDEVFVQLDDMPGHYKLTPEGNVEWWEDEADGNAGPLIGDLTGDGAPQAVYPSDGGDLYVYDAKTMDDVCHWTATDHDVWPGSISVSPTLADITGDGALEIIFGVRNVEDEDEDDWIERSNAHYFAVDGSCEVVWQTSPDWSNPHVHMHPVPLDVTGNGINDVIFQDWNTIGHKPGNWEHTGDSNLFALEGPTGDVLWRAQLPNYWSNKNIAVADVTGDGDPEILANEVKNGDGFSLYTPTGQHEDFIPAPQGWIVTKGPLVEDLDGDGRLEVLLPLHRASDHCEDPPDIGCREGALRIYTTSSTADPIYSNAHTLNADQTPTPAPTKPTDPDPDPPSDAFDATFHETRGNEWWVETDVDSQQTIESVHVSIDGGSWITLDATDWGSWATSTHIPEGSIIQLQARANGEHALSDCFRWTDASRADCPSGPDGSFDASFANVRGNEWWVETDVDAERGVASVAVRVDGGSWSSMEATDWGSWATSVHIPEGSVAQFQATGQDGSQALSECYRWTDASTTGCPGEDVSGLEASFVNVRGNEWWVETEVESDRSIEGVQARGDGGSWASLEATDWGSWALSAEVPEGTVVEFRATAGDGSSVVSDGFVWPP